PGNSWRSARNRGALRPRLLPRAARGGHRKAARVDSTHRWLAPDGASIFYRHWRPAKPRGAIVLLHGVASNSTRWWEFVADTALRDDWSLLLIDRRGQGESVWRKPAGMREWCDDIAGILAAEGFERGIVGGHCLGA